MKVEIIDPKEFGLEKTEVKGIEAAFAPKIAERNQLNKIYEQIIKKELSPELAEEAGDLRKKLVKVRTGIDKIHKSQKSFFLAAGRFVLRRLRRVFRSAPWRWGVCMRLSGCRR